MNILHIRKKDNEELILIKNVDEVDDTSNLSKIAIYRAGKKVGDFSKSDIVEWWISDEKGSE